MTDAVVVADIVATHAHAAQTEYAGNPYIDHPRRVESLLTRHGDVARCAGLLHDVLEDTDWTEDELRAMFGNDVTDIVVIVSRKAGETYAGFINRIVSEGNREASLVKLADVIDHLRPDENSRRFLAEHHGMEARYRNAKATLRTALFGLGEL